MTGGYQRSQILPGEADGVHLPHEHIFSHYCSIPLFLFLFPRYNCHAILKKNGRFVVVMYYDREQQHRAQAVVGLLSAHSVKYTRA